MAERPPIAGHTSCGVCGARIAARQDKAGRIYYLCNGEADESQCGSRVTMGHAKSREFMASVVKAKTAAPPAEKPAKPAKPLKENPAKKEAVTDDGPSRDGTDDRRSWL